jgi:hypothetical protein
MTMTSFQQGDSVVVMEGGREVSGRVESIQLKPAVKIDVRLDDPGHRRHCLIVAYEPDQVQFAAKPKEKSQSAVEPKEKSQSA